MRRAIAAIRLGGPQGHFCPGKSSGLTRQIWRSAQNDLHRHCLHMLTTCKALDLDSGVALGEGLQITSIRTNRLPIRLTTGMMSPYTIFDQFSKINTNSFRSASKTLRDRWVHKTSSIPSQISWNNKTSVAAVLKRGQCKRSNSLAKSKSA